MDINLRSPPKYRAYSRDIGNPYPKPAIGALKSLLLKSGSIEGVASTVVYMYVHTSGMALRGIPPPSSETLMVMSYFTPASLVSPSESAAPQRTSLPSATMTLIGGKSSESLPCVSTTARREFFSVSKSM